MPQKDLHITTKISSFSFTYIIIKTTMLLEDYLKNYATWIFHNKRKPTTKCWVKDFILPHKHHAQILIEDSGNLKLPENVKSVSNTTVSHLACCCVIPRPDTMKGWEKTEVDIKMFFAKVFLTIYCESKEVSCSSREMLEKLFWRSSLLTLFRMGFFGAAHGWGTKRTSCLKSVPHFLKWWNLVQLYLT